MRESLIESDLITQMSDRFRKIWVQRGKYDLSITLFPLRISDNYLILTVKGLYHGLSQPTRIEDVIKIINGE